MYLGYELEQQKSKSGVDGEEDVVEEIHSFIELSESSSYWDPNADSHLDHEFPEDDSPYAEVRAAVSNSDAPDMVSSSLRAWAIGLVFSAVISGANQFFYMRYPSVALGQLIGQLLVYPVGRLWARVVPRVTIFGISLNPGPFTIKEHVLCTVMAGIGSAESAYANDIIAVQRTVYHQTFSFQYQWMLVMSTQLIGFAMGGMRRFLVNPPSMIWPNTLVSCSLFNLLHSNYAGYGVGSSSMTRERFFLYSFIGTAIWGVFPGYLFTALSVFTWVCWLAPRNVRVNQIFGYRSGLGFSILSFDWNQIAYIGSPLVTPWWAEANILAAFCFFYLLLTPILYYSNVWYSQYLPMSSNFAFDRFGQPYDAKRLLDSNTGRLNITAYESYSPLFLPIPFAFTYGTSFMSISSLIVHTFLYFRKPIVARFKEKAHEQPDIHARLMTVYPKVPGWWYFGVFVFSFVLACVCTQVWPSGLPIWALILALFISLVYVIPIGMVLAQTNRIVGLNVLTELIVGYMIPGNPNAMMIFKTFGYITMAQGALFPKSMKFASDNKLGHYMKIPPRHMFAAQVVSAAVAATSQLAVQSWMFINIPDLCERNQKDNFVCAGTQVFGTASIVWGLIGPARIFTYNQIYYGLSFFFLIGAACPLITWFLARRYPNSIIKYIHFPLMFAGLISTPPATGVNYIPYAFIGWLFQYVIRRRCFSFWAKYNYILSAALDAGTALSVIIIYFALEYPTKANGDPVFQLSWWGNTVYTETLDWESVPYRTLERGQTFGPDTW